MTAVTTTTKTRVKSYGIDDHRGRDSTRRDDHPRTKNDSQQGRPQRGRGGKGAIASPPGNFFTVSTIISRIYRIP